MRPLLTNTQINAKLNRLILEVEELKQKIGIVQKKVVDDALVARIIHAVEKSYGIEDGMVFVHTQRRPIVDARMMAIDCLSRYANMTDKELTMIFELDRNSIKYALKKVPERVKLYKDTKAKYDQVMEWMKIYEEN
jgi:chromosomal replication initiation ATPase DnaA